MLLALCLVDCTAHHVTHGLHSSSAHSHNKYMPSGDPFYNRHACTSLSQHAVLVKLPLIH